MRRFENRVVVKMRSGSEIWRRKGPKEEESLGLEEKVEMRYSKDKVYMT